MADTYYEAHRTDLLQRAKARYQVKRDQCIKYQTEYDLKHKGKKRAWERQDRGKNPKKYYEKGLRFRYGLTFDEVKQRYVLQKGCCALCGAKFQSTKDMNVDHDHTTNVVRGLLCHHCNRGLGHFKDDPQLLAKAAAYVTPKYTV